MIANLSRGNILLLQVDNGLDYEDKNKEAKQMKKETAVLNVVKNAIQAKNAGFEKATINFTTQNENGDKEYSTYYLNAAQNGNIALNPKDKDKDPTIWIQKFEKDGKVGYGFSKESKGDGQGFVLNDKVAAFLDSVEVKEANGKSFVGVNVSLNDPALKQELFTEQVKSGQKAYAVIKNNGEIRIEQGSIPKDNAKQETQEQTQSKAQTIGNPNRQKQSDMDR